VLPIICVTNERRAEIQRGLRGGKWPKTKTAPIVFGLAEKGGGELNRADAYVVGIGTWREVRTYQRREIKEPNEPQNSY